MCEEKKEVRSNRLKKMRGNRVKMAGGWAVGENKVSTSLGERGEDETRGGHRIGGVSTWVGK